MQENLSVFLPGGMKQFRILKSKYILSEKKVLVIGSNSEAIAEKMLESSAAEVQIIVSDYDSLMNSRVNLKKDSVINVRMMDFENTDFDAESFDLVYAQASVSLLNRNKIVKEIKRILKPGGSFCVGEFTALKKDYPSFVKDIFESSDILPLIHDNCSNYYSERKFEIMYEEDLSSSLTSFYENAASSLDRILYDLSDKEKSYYKKLLNKVSHESNAYLKLGSDKYIGFKMLIVRKS